MKISDEINRPLIISGVDVIHAAENSIELEKLQKNSCPVDIILIGDALTIARQLPSDSVHCIISSPPYFGHRHYSSHPEHSTLEIGREEELKDYVQKICAVFAELYRVLNPTGTLWLNVGDTYRNEQLLVFLGAWRWSCKTLAGY